MTALLACWLVLAGIAVVAARVGAGPDQVLQLRHRARGEPERAGVVEVRRRVDAVPDHGCRIPLKTDPLPEELAGQNLKASLFNF